MKDVGILSVKTFNYGSLLQTYALQTYVSNLGLSNELVNYQKNNPIRQMVRLIYLPLLSDILHRVLKKRTAERKNPKYKKYVENRNATFFGFVRDYIHESKPYKGRKSLIQSCKNYRCILLGSDQVWHPFNYGAHFFDMSFVDANTPKLAYAPSFGVSTIPYYQKNMMRKYLSRIDVLSVREKSGQYLIKSLTGKDSLVVCDPTMLLTKEVWQRFMSEQVISDKYIFCYFIGDNPSHRNFAKRLSEHTGLKIVTLKHIYCYRDCDVNFGDISPLNVGPKEFVRLIHDAEYICTDSFHGTVFSILNEKQMFTFARFKNSSMSANSRLTTLFETFGLSDRFISSELSVEKAMKIPDIDYDIVSEKLRSYRQKSEEFLKENLMKYCGNDARYRKDC